MKVPGSLTSVQSGMQKHAAREAAKGQQMNATARDVQDHQQQMQDRINAQELEGQERIKYLQNEYDGRVSKERESQDEDLNRIRQDGYEKMLALKRQLKQEYDRIKRQGEKQIAQLTEAINTEILEAQKNAARKLKETQGESGRAVQAERNKNEFELANIQSENRSKMEAARGGHAFQLNELKDQSRKEFEEMKGFFRNANTNATKEFKDQYDQLLGKQKGILNSVFKQASDKVNSLRQDTARKLAAYSSRQEDPFYQFMEFNGQFEDAGDAFIFKATVPKYEQDNIAVNVKRDSLVISGTRSNSESVEVGPHARKTTASHQSFTESFPLDWPVSPKLVSKEFDGDTLIVRLPKQAFGSNYKPYEAPKQKPEMERKPDFPANLGIDPSKSPRHKPLG